VAYKASIVEDSSDFLGKVAKHDPLQRAKQLSKQHSTSGSFSFGDVKILWEHVKFSFGEQQRFICALVGTQILPPCKAL